uniref:superoxide dismutase n=1 Tax=Anopheles funestus TaxID=62324 RepID=A0A182RF40_ANOFN
MSRRLLQLGNAIKFNGGGHINHSIFWKNLSPDRSDPSADLQKALNRDFQSMDNFKKEMKAAAVAVQGSGWAWLGYNKRQSCFKLPLARIRIHWKQPPDLSHYWVSMYGSTPTIFSTKT